MLRKLGLVAAVAAAMWTAQGEIASADHCHHHGYSSGYRPPVVYYGAPGYSYNRQPIYGGYSGQSLYGSGYYNRSSYYGSGYGSGINAPFGGYGMGGFPRSGSYGGGGYGPGFSLYIGR